MSLPLERRDFLTLCAGIILVPHNLLTAVDDPPDRDLQKILRELPRAKSHIPRIQAACEKYAPLYPVPFIWPAKMVAIESAYNPDAISNSYAVGTAQIMPPTARELGAHLPPAEEFARQEEVLTLRRQYQSKFEEAVAAFRRGDDSLAAHHREKARTLQRMHDELHMKTMTAYKEKVFAMTVDERRKHDARFDPENSDDLIVHYMAVLCRAVKKELNLIDEAHILLLAAVAYNAGIGNVKRKSGIPVVSRNVEYANKLMLFQSLKL